ncbi:MAG: helix-turn-helix domain-containing protein [Desulfobulbaceae bacterium]|nr:helix-turn-helix domain-containing protein [Desulfobulbaceae bacterium]
MAKDNSTDTSGHPGIAPMVRIDGAKIRQLRERNKLTQLYLSTVVGVTTDTISRWENRHYQSIKLENAEKLAQALEVPLEEIEQQESPEPESQPSQVQPEPVDLPPRRRTGLIIIPAVLLSVVAAGILIYSMFDTKPHRGVSAERILPLHVSPGQSFPVLIRVHLTEPPPVSLIIKELIPHGTLALEGFPSITSIDDKENSLKWIRRIDTEGSVYAYMCKAPPDTRGNDRLVFSGTVTLKDTASDRQTIEGADSLEIAPYHWADSNRDYMIDDEEILAVYDIYSDMEELPFDRDLIDSIWASEGYAWDHAGATYITVD